MLPSLPGEHLLSPRTVDLALAEAGDVLGTGVRVLACACMYVPLGACPGSLPSQPDPVGMGLLPCWARGLTAILLECCIVGQPCRTLRPSAPLRPLCVLLCQSCLASRGGCHLSLAWGFVTRARGLCASLLVCGDRHVLLQLFAERPRVVSAGREASSGCGLAPFQGCGCTQTLSSDSHFKA